MKLEASVFEGVMVRALDFLKVKSQLRLNGAVDVACMSSGFTKKNTERWSRW